MPESVFDKLYQLCGFSGFSLQFFIHDVAQQMNQINILPLIESSDIIFLPRFSFVEDQVNGGRVIIHPKPIPDILSFTIDWQGPSVLDIIDHEWDKLFRKMMGAIVIGTI